MTLKSAIDIVLPAQVWTILRLKKNIAKLVNACSQHIMCHIIIVNIFICRPTYLLFMLKYHYSASFISSCKQFSRIVELNC